MTHTRSELLTDLADSVNELVEVRHHAEVVEIETREGSKRRRERRRHIQTLPSLLTALHSAMEPAATGEPGTGSFESRPSAELEPIAVLTLIRDESSTWARAFGIQRETLPGRLRGLVSAAHTDTQLANLVNDAARWVYRARLATGFEAADFTLNQPCPYCFGRHVLRITGDLERAVCRRCGSTWDEQTIGLLGQMLTANQDQETAIDVRCWWDECVRRGPHEAHADGAGRVWTDVCGIWPTAL